MTLSVPRLLPTKTYPFSDLRHMLSSMALQSGVVADEFGVTQDTGSNMNSKVAIGTSGAWIFGTDTSRQGAYHVFNDAAVTLTHPAANGTNPRIDQVVLRVYDSNVIGGGLDQASLEVIAGTATAGATLANRNGAANLTTITAPKTLIRLADVLIPAASTAVTSANIRDRRPWARGAYSLAKRTAGNITAAHSAPTLANSVLGVGYGTTDGTLYPRLEVQSGLVRFTLSIAVAQDAAAKTISINPIIDDVHADGVPSPTPSTQTAWGTYEYAAAGSETRWLHLQQTVAGVSSGSHRFGWSLTGTNNTSTLQATAALPLVVTVEEIVRANANNGVA